MSIIPTHILSRLDSRPIPDVPGEVRVFITAFNEMRRLPYLLDYYRRLGVGRFFCIDNASTDGTAEYLLAQPDVHLFQTSDSYAESLFGIVWQNNLLNRYGTGYWCLYVDADELLVYPHIEQMNLPAFCAALEQEGAEALYTFLLDMYPDGNMADAVCVQGRNFFEIAPLFDRDYTVVDHIQLRTKIFPPREVIGGPRLRCFFPEQNTIDQGKRLRSFIERRIRERLSVYFPSLKPPAKAPDIFKVPLIKWKKGNAFISSTHQVNPQKLSVATGVLAHFKFFSDFHDRVAQAINSGQHFGGSVEYKRYQQMMEAGADRGFRYEGTCQYTSSQQLLNLGLIRSSPAVEQAVAHTQSDSKG